MTGHAGPSGGAVPGQNLSRRAFGLSALAACAGTALPRAAHAASPRATLGPMRTVHLNTGMLRDPLLGPVTGPSTFSIALRLEDEPVALRLGFANDIGLDYRLLAASACVSTQYGDSLNPTGGAPWTLLTTNSNGRETAGMDTSGGQSRSLVVPGNGGGPRVPTLAWTDWCPIQSAPPDDGTQRPILFVRVSAPPWSAPRSCNGAHGFSGSPAAHGRDIYARLAVNEDHATAPGKHIGGYKPAEASPVYCVQYMSRTKGATVLWGGDSHFTGDTTPGNVDAFALQSCLALSTPARPVAAANYAWGGSPSLVFLPLLERMLQSTRPQIVILQGWTANDGASDEAADLYAQRVLTLAAKARNIGTQPVLVTRFARKSLSQNLQQALKADKLREAQLRLNSPSLPVLDATTILEDPSQPGIYRDGLSTDGTHPNEAGHAALAQALTPLLQKLL